MATIPSVPGDAALLDAVRAGDVAALRTLYERHGGVVLRCAMVVASHGAGTDPEQVAVDAFTSLWRDPPTLGAGESVAGHLLRLVGGRRHQSLVVAG